MSKVKVRSETIRSETIELNDKQLEFLIKCIDISAKSSSIHPDLQENELIRRLTNLHHRIEDNKYSEFDSNFDSCGDV